MIKIFTKIRRKLLSEGKSIKYVKYAIGEIILVVIGILIALQVSNWNETRKTQNSIEALFDEFENELATAVDNANSDLAISAEMDSIVKRVLANKVTRKDYANNDILRYLLTYRITLNPNLDNLDKLLEQEELLDEKYKQILFDINGFRYTREREIDNMNRLRISSEQNGDFMNLNFSWARLSDSLSNENAYHYFLTDEKYKNRLFSHWEKSMEYSNTINSYRVEMLGILSKLKILRAGYSASDIDVLFKNLGQKPLEKITENTINDHLKSSDEIGKSALIINFTKDTFNFHLKNEKGVIMRSGTSAPGEIFSIWPPEVDLFSNNSRTLELYKEDVLVQKYREVQYGYLLLK